MSIDAIADLNSRYTWTQKGTIGASWRIMKDTVGPLEGDCEDYALTVLWLLCERSGLRFWKMLLKGDAKLYVALTQPGNLLSAHAMLWVKGKGWIESTHRTWSAAAPYKPLRSFTFLEIVLNLGVGKIISWS